MERTGKLFQLSETDLDGIVAVHAAAFPESAITKLGDQAVYQYYKWLFVGPHDIYPVGIKENGRLVGFSFGGLFRGATSGFLQHNRPLLVRLLLAKPWLIANPIFRDRLHTAARLLSPWKKGPKSKLTSGKPGKPRPKGFSILSIAVMPACQGSGYGWILIDESERYARLKGFPIMQLTVHQDNQKAIAFYERQGWVKVFEDGHWQGKMEKAIAS